MEGLEKPFKVLHVADSHISCDDERDLKYKKYSARMNEAYKTTTHFQTGEKTDPVSTFHDSMLLAQKERVALIALTGDIVNYPSESSIEYVSNELRNTGIQTIYTAGNHDWHYEGLDGSIEKLREEWRNRRLKCLYSGLPSYSSTDVGGVRFVAIDNSTYQVDEEQLDFYRKQTAQGLPIVLLMHIPISLPTLRDSIIHKWGDPILCGDPDWSLARRKKWWQTEGNTKATLEFIKQVAATPNLVAALCGHTHSFNTDSVNPTAAQYIHGGGFCGADRVVEFRPLV